MRIHPSTEPFAEGVLETVDGQRIAWEQSGSPDGIPVVVLHGGPGSGRTVAMRCFFDPDRYRIILYDQRGCGTSEPHAADPAVDLDIPGVIGVKRLFGFPSR